MLSRSSILILMCTMAITSCKAIDLRPKAQYSCGKEVPAAHIEIDGQKQKSKVGGYCWGGVCTEPGAWPSAIRPLLARSPVQVKLQLPAVSPLTHVEYQLRMVGEHDKYKIGPDEKLSEEDKKYFAETALWDVPVENVVEVKAIDQQTLSPELKPGLYLLTVFGWWKSCGDATHGFLFEVRE